MATQQSPNVLHTWFEEVWNKARPEAIDELSTPDVVAHGLTDSQGRQVAGREPFKQFWRDFHSAFPDIRIEVEDSLAVGDKVMVRCTVRATHSGDGLGFPPSGKPITFTGMCMARVKDGRIAEAWNSFDFLTLFQQLDKVPSSFA